MKKWFYSRFLMASIIVCLAGGLVGISVSGVSSEDHDGMILRFGNGICMNVDTEAPEISDVRTARRFSLQAPHGLFLEATTLDLTLPSASDRILLSINSAKKLSTKKRATYFGRCDFTDGVPGFVKQVKGRGGCTVVGSQTEVYHSSPGSHENVIVCCNPALPGVCYSMTLFHAVDPIELTGSATIREPNPATWLPIAGELRAFLRANVSHLPEC